MNTPTREPLRFLVVSASGRADSLNTQLARLAAATIEADGSVADLATVKDFAVPDYDGDAEARNGIPLGAEHFKRRLEDADALVVVSPEYNASIPGVLKNLLDWVSRFRPQPFSDRQTLLMSASPSMVGGNRGLWALRVPLEHLGARVYPGMFSLARADTMLTTGGLLSDSYLQQRFDANVIDFVNLVEAATHYPRVKNAWAHQIGVCRHAHPAPGQTV
ncbi:NADPH-dependent FMN reductase [Streptomyces sp. NBC_00258]|uniref:NADPH-dependent FMN reductase n=1 Tax=Streptomyces sp. NBC_00258 TaxID=2903642 RepID=UPI002E2898DB|nr:NAD(P)H-dependent oxidoreductase [Streptomyces sp. NBC_00258]